MSCPTFRIFYCRSVPFFFVVVVETYRVFLQFLFWIFVFSYSQLKASLQLPLSLFRRNESRVAKNYERALNNLTALSPFAFQGGLLPTLFAPPSASAARFCLQLDPASLLVISPMARFLAGGGGGLRDVPFFQDSVKASAVTNAEDVSDFTLKFAPTAVILVHVDADRFPSNKLAVADWTPRLAAMQVGYKRMTNESLAVRVLSAQPSVLSLLSQHAFIALGAAPRDPTAPPAPVASSCLVLNGTLKINVVKGRIVPKAVVSSPVSSGLEEGDVLPIAFTALSSSTSSSNSSTWQEIVICSADPLVTLTPLGTRSSSAVFCCVFSSLCCILFLLFFRMSSLFLVAHTQSRILSSVLPYRWFGSRTIRPLLGKSTIAQVYFKNYPRSNRVRVWLFL